MSLRESVGMEGTTKRDKVLQGITYYYREVVGNGSNRLLRVRSKYYRVRNV